MTAGSCLTFVQELRRLTNAWAVPPADFRFDPPEADRPLVAWLDICDAEHDVALLTVGVHVTDGRLTGDVLHNQLMTLPPKPTRFRIEAEGSPATLAGKADAWFRMLVAMAFERREYGTRHRPQHRVVLAETGLSISETRDCPPPHAPFNRASPITITY